METVQRYSRKREAIREALMSTRDHPSAEQLYSRLKPLYPDLSLGTVYRNLAAFRDSGQAVRVATVNGEDRFDGNTAPHAHFICERCGAVLDVDTSLPELDRIDGLPGTAREFALTFFGICDPCSGS